MTDRKARRGRPSDLTERDPAEDTLRRTLAMQEAIFEGSRDAVFISDAESRFVAVNAAACELTGYSVGELLSMRIPDLHEEIDLQAYSTHHDSIMAGAEVLSKAPTLRKDGRKVETEFNSRRFFIGGKPLMHTTARDISARKRAEDALKESEERYRDLVESASDLICTHDLRGVLLSVNAAAARAVGVASEEIVGRSLRDFLPSARWDELDAYLDAIRRNGAAVGIMQVLTPARDVRFWEYRNTLRTAGVESPVVRGMARDVTDQVLARRALKRSEEKYRTILETIEESYYEVDIAGNLTFFNDSLCRLLGYSRDELTGMNDRQYTDTENARKLYAAFNVVYRTGEPTRGLDWEIVRKDGTKRIIEASVALRRDAAGEPIGFRGIIRDVTERKRAEAALRESSELLSAFIRNSPIYAYIKDVSPGESRVLIASENYSDMVGVPGSEMAGKTMQELFPEDFAAKITADDWTVVTRGEVLHLDEDLNGRNYTTIKFPITLGGKHLLAGYTIDITERERAEEALRESREMLRESQHIAGLGSYVLDIPSGVWERTDLLDSVLGIDGSFDRSVEGWASLVHPDDREMMVDYFANEVLGKGRRFDKEYRIVRPRDRAVRWVHGLGKLEKDPEGRLLRMRGTIQDVTERKLAEDELAHSRAQLVQAQKLESVGRLAGGVAHDFNNILQALLSLATVLRLKAGTPELAEIVGEIEAHVQRGAGLTQQLLLFSRRQMAEKKRLDLGELTSAATVLLRRLIPENIRLTVDTTPGRLWAEGDSGQLQQVLMNLAVNAKDAMPEGGTLTVRTWGRAGEVVLEVIDTGHGLDEETRAHLFEPFFTTKEAGRGTGLGLSVVHGIVEHHGGRVEVESALNEGTRFRVVLPAAPPPGEAAGAPRDEPILPHGRGERVLIVEDEDGARKGLTELLTMLGYEVTAVGSGEEAGVLPTEPAPDVLLTDLMLPGIDGAALAVGLRGRWPRLEVVLMSGYTEDEAVRGGVDEGSVHFLQKPFDIRSLARAVRAALAARGGDGAPR